MPSIERYRGCLLGLAAGDALGAPYEGGALERAVWRGIGRTRDGARRWTDDTRTTLDLAESLLANGGLDQDDLARRFAESYRWDRGYGPGTAKVLKRIRRGEGWREAARAVYPDGSYGNGAAMRSAVLGMFFPDDRLELQRVARESAVVTHGHAEGVDGALLMGVLAASSLRGETPREGLESALSACATTRLLAKLELLSTWLEREESIPADRIVRELGNGMTVESSCPAAAYLALRHRGDPFEALLGAVREVGGDVDTIGAMAGALWGAGAGRPEIGEERVEDWDRIEALADRIHAQAHKD